MDAKAGDNKEIGSGGRKRWPFISTSWVESLAAEMRPAPLGRGRKTTLQMRPLPMQSLEKLGEGTRASGSER